MKKEVKETRPTIEQEEKSHPVRSFFSRLFIVAFLFLSLLALYGFFIEPYNLKVNEHKITNKNILDEHHGLKIAHLSDLHYGTFIKEEQLKNIVNRINLTKPDIIVFTGDLIDRHVLAKTTVEEKEIMNKELANQLSKLKATIGKYAITGNHDTKNKQWPIIIENSGFINLNDASDLIYKDVDTPILLSGLSSNLSGTLNVSDKYKKIRDEVVDEVYSYSILILHEPDYIYDIDYGSYNLILSGHSHNGQIRIPFIGPIARPVGAKELYAPYYQINDTKLYISNGVGNTILNIRLFNPPSFNLYRLTNK